MKKLYVFFLFALTYFPSFSQGEFVIEINRTDGSFLKMGPLISGVTYIYPNFRAYDENNKVYIFPSSNQICSVNATNNAIINNPAYNNLLVEFEYSNLLDKLYGLLKDNTNNVKNFVSINQISGLPTIIGASIPTSATYQGISAFAQIHSRYIFLDPSKKIFSIDATNGNVISNPSLVLLAGEQLLNIAFNDSTNTLYGILIDNSNLYYLVSIDISTGVITKIGTGTTFGASGSSAIDQINQQFLYLYNDGTYKIATIDIATGNVMHNNPITPLNGLDNVFSLKYDNIQQKIYAIHWDDSIVPDNINDISLQSDITLFPNPSNGVFTVKSSLEVTGIEVFNVLGERIEISDQGIGNNQQITPNGYSLITMALSTQPEGIYFVRISTERSFAAKKIIIRK